MSGSFESDFSGIRLLLNQCSPFCVFTNSVEDEPALPGLPTEVDEEPEEPEQQEQELPLLIPSAQAQQAASQPVVEEGKSWERPWTFVELRCVPMRSSIVLFQTNFFLCSPF
jgi:hypothetical protein